MELTTESSKRLSDRRQHPRFQIPFRVYTREKNQYNEKLCNISYGGLCFRSPNTFSVNDFVFVRLSSPGDNSGKTDEFAVVGRVRRRSQLPDGQFEYGIQHRFYDDPYSEQMRTRLCQAIEQFA
jgi:hypothetical protein